MNRPEPPREFDQPASFAFADETMKKVEAIITRYPEGRQQAAVLPVLMLAQKQHENWLPIAAMEEVARLLDMPFIRVQEVATFYSMYNLTPMGRYHIQVCTTTPCWLRGSDELLAACYDTAGIRPGQTSGDGLFTMTEVECLGACCNAPMIEITSSGFDEYFEDLNYDQMTYVLNEFRMGRKPVSGSYAGRKSSEPVTGPTTLENQKKGWEEHQKQFA